MVPAPPAPPIPKTRVMRVRLAPVTFKPPAKQTAYQCYNNDESYRTTREALVSSIDMFNNDVGKESAQKFMKQTGDLKAATLYFAS